MGLGFKKDHRCPEVLANITACVFKKNKFEVMWRPFIYLAMRRVWEAGRRKAILTNNTTPQ